MKSATETNNPRDRRFALTAFAIAGGLVGLAACLIFIVNRSSDIAGLGQRGDFFGGFLNPILTALTLAGLLYTLHLQRQEQHDSRIQFEETSKALSEQNRAIREQNYQAGFFQLLAIYNDIVNAIRVKDTVEKEEARGRDAFSVIYSRMARIYRQKRADFPGAGDERALQFAYDSVFKEAQGQLAHYFRYLYNTIRLLEAGSDAEKYIRILRAQISNQELLVLYYNCAISQHGKNFIDIAVRHELFDNIPPWLLDPTHGKLLPDAAFGAGGYDAILKTSGPRLRGDLSDAFGPKLSRKRPPASSASSEGDDKKQRPSKATTETPASTPREPSLRGSMPKAAPQKSAGHSSAKPGARSGARPPRRPQEG